MIVVTTAAAFLHQIFQINHNKTASYLIDEVVLAEDGPAGLDEVVLGLGVLGQGVPQRVLGQAEEIRVAHGAHVGRAPVAGLVAGDVQDGHLNIQDSRFLFPFVPFGVWKNTREYKSKNKKK